MKFQRIYELSGLGELIKCQIFFTLLIYNAYPLSIILQITAIFIPEFPQYVS